MRGHTVTGGAAVIGGAAMVASAPTVDYARQVGAMAEVVSGRVARVRPGRRVHCEPAPGHRGRGGSLRSPVGA